MLVADTGGSLCSSQDSEENKNLSLHQLLQLPQEPEQDQKAVLVTPPVGRKVKTRARAARLRPSPGCPALPPRRCQLLCRPALAAGCAAQVSPLFGAGGGEGSAGPSPEHRARPARPRLRGRLLCSGPCASLSLPSRPPSLLVSEAIEFLFKITETVL